MQKKLLSLVLMLIAAINTFAYRDFTVDGIRYGILSEENGTCAVWGLEKLTKSDLVIPTSVTNGNGTKYTVKSIGNKAFADCSGLTSITIPESVTDIGEKAFYGCSGLTSFNIPENVTCIGERAFYGCSGLTSITIPGNVFRISTEAFDNCENLSTAIIKYGQEQIFLLSRCFTSIKKLIVNRYFGGSCLNSFSSNLNIVEIGDQCTFIDSNLFNGCSGLTSITIPESVTYIGERAFYGCSSLTSINIPQNVTSIESEVFKGCSSLTSINIPQNVTSIKSGAFYGCSSLTSINIPQSVTSIESQAFGDCENLTVTIEQGGTDITLAGECLDIKRLIANRNINGQDPISNLFFADLGDNVTHIGDELFKGCSRLTSINIPESVTWIGEMAFAVCI